MKLVITMSRRFGTGASIIATELSKRLDIPVYDKAYIEEQLNDRMYESEDYLFTIEEVPPNLTKNLNLGSSSNLVVISFLFQLSSSFLILLKVVDMFAFKFSTKIAIFQ